MQGMVEHCYSTDANVNKCIPCVLMALLHESGSCHSFLSISWVTLHCKGVARILENLVSV